MFKCFIQLNPEIQLFFITCNAKTLQIGSGDKAFSHKHWFRCIA